MKSSVAPRTDGEPAIDKGSVLYGGPIASGNTSGRIFHLSTLAVDWVEAF